MEAVIAYDLAHRPEAKREKSWSPTIEATIRKFEAGKPVTGAGRLGEQLNNEPLTKELKRLAGESRAVLRGERSISLRAWRETKRIAKTKTSKEMLSGPAQELFERLRTWRAEAARSHGVPAYVIFHDATLRDIAHTRPASLAGRAEGHRAGQGPVDGALPAQRGRRVSPVAPRRDGQPSSHDRHRESSARVGVSRL